ncbi:MAG: hypothetical protein JNL51_04250 [Chitinophagaceae bacterium]|nr:hypothetical protein [Chitinophagaceae bacterium]
MRPYNFQEENEKLIREKRELENTIEKLEFFNGLLEKEIRELKGGGNEQEQDAGAPAPMPFYYPRPKKRISLRAFNLVLLIAIFLGAFAFYSIFIIKADYPFFRRLQGKPPIQLSAPASKENIRDTPAAGSATPRQSSSNASSPAEQAGSFALPKNQASGEAAIKENKRLEASQNQLHDGAQNPIVPGRDAASADRREQKNAPATPSENNSKENIAAIPPSSGGASLPNAASSKNENSYTINATSAAGPSVQPAPVNASNASASTTSPATGSDNKKSLGVYKVASKANFYDKPELSALNGTFIYQFSTVELHALDETKDFIYVTANNNLGNTVKGWLSKKDLRRIDQ